MNSSNPFLLVGNGSYQNRGCEAIVRGTMEILRNEFGPEVRAQSGVFATPDVVAEQNSTEVDHAIRSFSVSGAGKRFTQKWWLAQAQKRIGLSTNSHLMDLSEQIDGVCVALEVGGDNYSLDYGKPESFMAMDRYLRKKGVPVILWGASVGPFDADPKFAPRIFDHLRQLEGVFVRESSSREYLQEHGVIDNVHLVADPAFLMQPVEPPAEKIGFPLPEGAIGINLSPLVGRFRGQTPEDIDIGQWLSVCTDIVREAATCGYPIVLIPHVESAWHGNDDYDFLNAISRSFADDASMQVGVLPLGLNAAELKWVIARCQVFAGARTHATIASLSSQVPTLSIGYSLKAKGINKDVFGSLDYCMPVSELTPETFKLRLQTVIARQEEIRKHLAARIPEIQHSSLMAGSKLRTIIETFR
jgi:colanic acid/amylovoran biosynthesis protein